jgi:hypothetical protein
MRRFFIPILFVFFTINVVAQNIQTNQVPEIVLQSFNGQYTNVSQVQWSSLNNNFVVKFNYSGKNLTSHYQPTGEWIMTEQLTTLSAIPGQISDDINNRFNSNNFVAVYKETKPYTVEYRYEYSSGSNTIQVWYSETAEILRRNIVQ